MPHIGTAMRIGDERAGKCGIHVTWPIMHAMEQLRKASFSSRQLRGCQIQGHAYHQRHGPANTQYEIHSILRHAGSIHSWQEQETGPHVLRNMCSCSPAGHASLAFVLHLGCHAQRAGSRSPCVACTPSCPVCAAPDLLSLSSSPLPAVRPDRMHLDTDVRLCVRQDVMQLTSLCQRRWGNSQHAASLAQQDACNACKSQPAITRLLGPTGSWCAACWTRPGRHNTWQAACAHSRPAQSLQTAAASPRRTGR